MDVLPQGLFIAFLNEFFQVPERFICFDLFLIFAGTGFPVFIDSAMSAKAFTTPRAYWNKRKMQDYFLPDHLI